MTSSHNPLLKHDLPRVIAREVEQRYFLGISVLIPRIFSVSNEHQSLFHIDQWPLGFADLLLAQCRCHGIPDDPSHRYKPSRGRLKIFNQFVEFVLCRPSVTLIALSNQVEMTQRHAGEAGFFGGNLDAMDRSGMGYDCSDERQIDSQRCVWLASFRTQSAALD